MATPFSVHPEAASLGSCRRSHSFAILDVAAYDRLGITGVGAVSQHVVSQVLFFRDQEMTPPQHKALARHFGELHLHPAAHQPLADLFIDYVKDSKNTCLIETHSQNFLFRIRRRIKEGKLNNKDVIIYYVQDNEGGGNELLPIEIDGERPAWCEFPLGPRMIRLRS